MKTWLLPLAGLLACMACHAEAPANCEALRTAIQAKIAATGVTQFSLTTVDADARTEGRVVGSCALGSKKIVYTATAGAGVAAVPAGATGSAMLTECRDGTQSVGGDCKR